MKDEGINPIFHYIFGFCLILFLSGCTTYNTATGRNEFIFISTQKEVSLGQEVHQKLTSEFKFSDDLKKLDRLYTIGERLALISDRQDYSYNFYLIEEDEMNAFTTPGGNIYFYTGLFDRLETDDRIASVLAHEIGHCAARHTIKKYQAALGYSLVGSLVLKYAGLEEGAQDIAKMSSDAVMNLVFSAYGRRDEYEADRLGVKYMYLADFNLDGMIETLEILQEESKGSDIPLFLRSHPYLDDRIVEVKKEIERVRAEFN